ncbi:MAG: hypothetical protein GEU78_00570 [Actinobacteria bacterium]|nr:hypothetical protein [Actinomycetota bacterium]
MPDVLLFGATGYTGRLTAEVLAELGVDFAIAGRNRTKLDVLAATIGGPDVRIVSADDIEALTQALTDVKVLITCVGPFVELGDAAAEAAVRARVHYIDSSGESIFIRRLIDNYDARAREAGIAMAPALGFDEVVADTAGTLATDGMEEPDLVLTYALPRYGSAGTVESSLAIIAAPARFISDGAPRRVEPGELARWAPMPAPLGPRMGISMALGETQLAPLHLSPKNFGTYVTVARGMRTALRASAPLLRAVSRNDELRGALRSLVDRRGDGPAESQRERARFTILAEARSGRWWRNVSLQGADVYGLTAHTLTAGAKRFLEAGFDERGVIAPVQALGSDDAQKVLIDRGVTIKTYGPREGD